MDVSRAGGGPVFEGEISGGIHGMLCGFWGYPSATADICRLGIYLGNFVYFLGCSAHTSVADNIVICIAKNKVILSISFS